MILLRRVFRLLPNLQFLDDLPRLESDTYEDESSLMSCCIFSWDEMNGFYFIMIITTSYPKDHRGKKEVFFEGRYLECVTWRALLEGRYLKCVTLKDVTLKDVTWRPVLEWLTPYRCNAFHLVGKYMNMLSKRFYYQREYEIL